MSAWKRSFIHISVSIFVSTWDLRDTQPCSLHAVTQFQLVNNVTTLASFFMRILLAACFQSTMTPPSVTHMFLQLFFGGHWTWTHLESHSVYTGNRSQRWIWRQCVWSILLAFMSLFLLLQPTQNPCRCSPPLALQAYTWSGLLKVQSDFFFFLYSLCLLTQSRGWGSAMGMVCRTSSSSCRARCKWISIQQGVSLMLCRG